MPNLATPKVELREATPEPPRLGRLGWIAAACFAAGLVWPTLAGFRLVQRPPGSTPRVEEPESPDSEADPTAPAPLPKPLLEPGAARSSDEAVPAARVELAPGTGASVQLEGTVVASCHDGAGRRLESCDKPELGPAFTARLGELAECEGTTGASGVLSLGVELDFAANRVQSVKVGQSTTLSRDAASVLARCAEEELVGEALGDVVHRHGRYWLYFLLRFTAAGEEARDDRRGDELVVASGQATVGWQTATVRTAPSREAEIATRLMYGTRVEVTGRRGDWYRVKYDGRGSVGWVHRETIGL